MSHFNTDGNGYAEIKFYEKAFEELPEHVRAIAEKLAVKQMVAAAQSKKLEDHRAMEQKLRNEFAETAEEIETLKLELRDQCHRFVNDKENR